MTTLGGSLSVSTRATPTNAVAVTRRTCSVSRRLLQQSSRKLQFHYHLEAAIVDRQPHSKRPRTTWGALQHTAHTGNHTWPELRFAQRACPVPTTLEPAVRLKPRRSKLPCGAQLGVELPRSLAVAHVAIARLMPSGVSFTSGCRWASARRAFMCPLVRMDCRLASRASAS
jgi:hypothetical protein